MDFFSIFFLSVILIMEQKGNQLLCSVFSVLPGNESFSTAYRMYIFRLQEHLKLLNTSLQLKQIILNLCINMDAILLYAFKDFIQEIKTILFLPFL